MLIDDVTAKIAAGNGGKGAVAFNKNMMALGPTGAAGGRGGNVIAIGISDIGALNQFRFQKEFSAENGHEGRSQFRDGHDGADLILKLPVGTVAHNLTTGFDTNLEHVGERVVLAKGGLGGRGNFYFRSAHNTSPKSFQRGLPGEIFTFRFELKLIADVGFIGMPNAGKSSMLNRLTEARSKVASYPFTTLEPNLGVHYGLILADIPGLIEGSSSGKGLGTKFLRHIERTPILFHFVSSESENPKRDYQTIRRELGTHNKQLLRKPEYLFLSKSDLIKIAALKKKLAILKKLNPTVTAVSLEDNASIKEVEKILHAIETQKTI